MILKIRSKYSLSCFVYISSAAASTSQTVTFPTPQAHPEFKFGTKQPYPIPFDECSPLAAHLSEATTVHGIFRHGYRFPSVKDMKKYKELFPQHKFSWQESDAHELAERGWKEHERFGRILARFLNTETVLKSSRKSRSKDSLNAFLKGANQNSLHKNVQIDDLELRFWESCAAHHNESKPKRSKVELNKARLHMNVTSEEKNRYFLCAYETFINGQKSQFCEGLKRDLSILNDVKHWYRTGFGGGEKNYESTRPLLKGVLANIEDGISSFRFGHAETTLPLIAKLGLVPKTPELAGDNLPTTYAWKTAELAPMASNIWIILNESENTAILALNEKIQKTMTYHDFIKYWENHIPSVETIDEACALPKQEL